ncbi:hypothetical protein OG559_30480 [Micromonospora sp. NBC_01405]|uniref:hypothetical protein n=1 Tax=Micromonospora sp. NBC_01405 TaxID=2903589 RepID=UPI003245BC8D
MRLLAVPVRVDALWLATDRTATGPTADFTRLPYLDAVTGRDANTDERFLSDAILPAPFQQDLLLPAGIHLHWSLPDALTRLTHVATTGGTRPAVDLPRVPNRWLVTRTRPDGVQDRWVVESDALTDIDRGSVVHPLLDADPRGSTGRPWRYLGRRLPLSAWPGTPTDRLAALTALDYGEPTFAAFYPNSSSVFGHHDEEYGAVAPPDGLRYDVVGWYVETADDELLAALSTAGDRSWSDTLADELGWSVPDNGGIPPARMVCFGRLTFASSAKRAPATGPGAAQESWVWVANTASEALAAHLGAVLPGVTETDTEELLEALTFADELESSTLDLPVRLAQARHESSFGTVAAGTVWTVRRQDDPLDGNGDGSVDGNGTGLGPVSVEQRQARERLTLPAGFGDLLVALNEAQSGYDAAAAEVTGARQRIFADWHRYLVCAYPQQGRSDYPDPDLVAMYLRREVSALAGRLAALGSWPPVGTGTGLVHRLLAARQAAEQALDTVNVAASTARSRFALQQVPGTPYQLANEPVVLLTGAAATPSDRYGQDGADQPDGLLPCAVLDVPGLAGADLGGPAGVRRLADFTGALATKLAAAEPDHPGLRSWTDQPWHPVLLHWEVEFFPARAGNNLDPAGRDFDPDFVTTNYTLPYGDRELRPRPENDVLDTGANVYAGSTVLSAAARPVLSTRILRYLRGTPLARANDERQAAGLPPITADQLDADPAPLLGWCAAQTGDPRLGTLAAAHRHLAEHEESNLAQSLGGFNDALVMRHLVRQLPIIDPTGFASGRALAALVDQAVAGQGRHAPVPLSDFNPIRAGALRLRRLRIVGSFGVGYDVDVDQPRTTSWLTMPNRPTWVAMPPRLAVPARVRLDLLDADADAVDRPVSGLPDSSPVCGWLLPDPLDDGLRVYATGGDWLGTLYLAADPAQPGRARWEAAPDGPVTDVGLIGNLRLRTVVERLRGLGASGLADFLTGLDDALEAVGPADPGQHQGRAMLIGRPVAVVRLALDLTASGLPAIHQDWNVFRQDLGRTGRETNEYPSVRFPVRLGERGRLGDGTLGYWLEDGRGALGDRYHDVVTLAEADGDPPLTVGIDLPARTLTVLLEPAGAIHATTGVLPTVSSRLDPAHHHEALARLETGFLAAPVLTGADTLGLVTPAADPDRVWSWRERDGAGWVETTEPPELADTFPTGLTAREGWLTLRQQSPA